MYLRASPWRSYCWQGSHTPGRSPKLCIQELFPGSPSCKSHPMELSQFWGWEREWVLVWTPGPGSHRLSQIGVPCWGCERRSPAWSPSALKWIQCDCPSAEDGGYRPEGKGLFHLLAERNVNITSCYNNANVSSKFLFVFFKYLFQRHFQVFFTVPFQPFYISHVLSRVPSLQNGAFFLLQIWLYQSKVFQ